MRSDITIDRSIARGARPARPKNRVQLRKIKGDRLCGHGGLLRWGMDLAPHILVFLGFVAFVAGFVDSLAGGGGLLTIPALMAVGVPPVSALATNKFQSSFGTGGAFLAFARNGHIDFRRYAPAALAAIVGSALGAITVQVVSPTFLAACVPVLLVAMMVYYWVAPPARQDDVHPAASPRVIAALCFVIGFYDGFFGPGTGSFFMTMLLTLGGLSMLRAIAHTKMLNFSTNIAALAMMIAGGKVLWLAGSIMALGSIAGNQVGAHVAMRFRGRGVRVLLIVMSGALTIKLLADPANPLRVLAGL